MAEYITKEAAIQTFEWGEADVIEDYGDGGNFGFSRGVIKSAINAIPAADVVPVVRCKDCKYLFGTLCAVCGLLPRKPEDFCSRGERKDNADAEG